MAATASPQQCIDLVREYTADVFNGREYDRIDELESEHYVQYGPLPEMTIQGSEESLETMKLFHAAFSDVEATEELCFSDGEYVCTAYTYRGTHDGDFMGLPPTDVAVEVPGIVINRIEDGKIAEAWTSVDFLSVLQQVGAVGSFDDLAA